MNVRSLLLPLALAACAPPETLVLEGLDASLRTDGTWVRIHPIVPPIQPVPGQWVQHFLLLGSERPQCPLLQQQYQNTAYRAWERALIEGASLHELCELEREVYAERARAQDAVGMWLTTTLSGFDDDAIGAPETGFYYTGGRGPYFGTDILWNRENGWLEAAETLDCSTPDEREWFVLEPEPKRFGAEGMLEVTVDDPDHARVTYGLQLRADYEGPVVGTLEGEARFEACDVHVVLDFGFSEDF